MMNLNTFFSTKISQWTAFLTFVGLCASGGAWTNSVLHVCEKKQFTLTIPEMEALLKLKNDGNEKEVAMILNIMKK